MFGLDSKEKEGEGEVEGEGEGGSRVEYERRDTGKLPAYSISESETQELASSVAAGHAMTRCTYVLYCMYACAPFSLSELASKRTAWNLPLDGTDARKKS